MALQGWQRLYLDALRRSRTDRIQQYETVEFIASVMDEPPTGVQELLLHRTIAGLTTVDHAVALLKIIRDTHLGAYGPRILARIGDTAAVLKAHPELDEHLRPLKKRTGYTQPHSINGVCSATGHTCSFRVHPCGPEDRPRSPQSSRNSRPAP